MTTDSGLWRGLSASAALGMWLLFSPAVFGTAGRAADSDHLIGAVIVTNGRLLRVLRDSSRLVKLNYLEFDLDRIFTDGLFADFDLQWSD